MTVIDADGHVHEADELFTEYLDPAFRERTSGFSLDDNNNRRFFFDGVAHPPFPIEISIRKPMIAENRLKVLDKERIQSAVLFPSATLIASYLDPDFADAVVRAYNSWISDYVKPHRTRLLFAGMVTLHDVPAAIAEAQRAVGDLGAVAIAVRPNPTAGRTLDSPDYDPFYAALQELGVPLTIHESTGCMETAGGDRYGGMMNPAAYVFSHMISHSFEQMFAAMSIIGGGVLERFPRLKVAFLEAGCSWTPYWLARLDDHHAHPKLGGYLGGPGGPGGTGGGLSLKPSEYFERQCMVTCDPGDHTIPLAIQGIGAHKIMFATDYPHFDSGAGSVAGFTAVEGISAADQDRILWRNAAEFYGINTDISAA
jgi:uncharacterized protein